MSEPPGERALKLEKLANVLPNMPKSFLDKLSDRLISFLTPSEIQQLYLAKEPLENETPDPPSDLNISNISALVSAAAEEITQRMPETYIKPIYPLGDGFLQAKDLEGLRLFRKDGRGMTSLEGTLEFYNAFLSGLSTSLNETECIKGLHTILPNECLPTLEQLKYRKATLPIVYSTLQTIHGSRKSLDELQSAIENLMKNGEGLKPLEVLSKMNVLLLKSSSNQADMDATAVRETRRFLKTLGGETLWNSVLAHFNTTPGKHFRELLRILTEHFSETLADLHAKSIKIKRIVVEPVPVNPLAQSDRPVTVNEIKKFLSIPDKTDISQGLCFGCGQGGHIMRDCRNKQTKASPGPNPPRSAPVPPNFSLPYHDQLCSVHTRGSHNNGACYSQQNVACSMHPNSQPPHSQAECRARGGGRGNKPQGGSQKGQTQRNSNANRNPNWANPTNQPNPQLTYQHPLNLPPPRRMYITFNWHRT